MFIRYDELDLLDFFESEPTCIGEYEAGDWIYSYGRNDFAIVVLISTYEKYVEISITYKDYIIYSQKHNNVSEIKRGDSCCLKLLFNKDNVIIIKKEPQIGVVVE